MPVGLPGEITLRGVLLHHLLLDVSSSGTTSSAVRPDQVEHAEYEPGRGDEEAEGRRVEERQDELAHRQCEPHPTDPRSRPTEEPFDQAARLRPDHDDDGTASGRGP